MVNEAVLYSACVAGAVGLLLMAPRAGSRTVPMGALLAAAALGAAFLAFAPREGGESGVGAPFYILAFLAAGGAVRLITHSRPVYAALYFIVVVICTAGLFVLLDAEFMAFALVIVYAGAILVTYLFVIMLAQEPGEGWSYDASAREPVAAVTAGFLLLALVLHLMYGQPMPSPADSWAISDAATRESLVRKTEGEAIENVERLGSSLMTEFPVSLEVAGVILMLAMVGAAVLARQVGGEKAGAPG